MPEAIMAVGAKSPVPTTDNSKSAGGAAGCLVRSIWLMVGNVALVFSAVLIVKQRQGLGVTWADGLFWGIAVLTAVSRYVDVRHFDGQTSEGEPSTMQHAKKFIALLAVAAVALWIAAHGVAHITAA
jgi:hypothetical protein